MKRIALSAILLSAACTEVTPTPPVSLEGPTAIAVARGRVCMDLLADGDARIPSFGECTEGRKGAIGLVVNEQTDRLTFVALDRFEPLLADLRHSVPGVTHLPVGRLPADVAVSSDGTTAYTLNQIDGDLSIVNLWKPAVDSRRIQLPATPIALETRPGSADVVVAAGSPSVLWKRAGATCETNGCELPDDPGTLIELEGTVTDFAISPDGVSAFVAYRDLDYVSVVNLESMTLDTHIGAAPSCSDGLDNDGDGFSDAADGTCYGPFDAEAQGFAGKYHVSSCTDGLDNDEDGLVDRDDPDCYAPDAQELSAQTDVQLAMCNDGIDNDGDGRADYPEDTDCFGPYGVTEVALDPAGFDAIDIDELGLFVYLVDRARNQVVVIDAQARKVIDAAASTRPSLSEFTNTIGIAVLPTPLDVAATVRRDCLSETNVAVPCTEAFFTGSSSTIPYPHDEVVVRYAFGAWVAEDTGRLRYVEAMDAFCRVPTDDARTLLDADFVEPGALEGSLEEKCLFVPSLPLVPREDFAGECELPCTDCDTELLSERFFCQDGQGVIVNPRFGLVDILTSSARTGGKSQCEIPAQVDAQMRAFASLPNAPSNFRCTSPLLPQPIAVEAKDLNPDNFDSLDELERVNLTSTQQAYFGWSAEGVQAVSLTRPADERLTSESWTVAFEGTLPATRRNDGLLATATTTLDDRDVVRFDAGPLDLCAAGVQEGDLLTLLETPDDAAGCEAFAGDPGFLTFEVVKVTASTLELGLSADEAHVSALPTRECFPRGLAYSVRPNDAWIVVGERTGFISSRESMFGECVDIPAAQEPNIRNGRVKTGETFVGPYFSFYLWPGPSARDAQSGEPTETPAVNPVEGLSFTFSVLPNFLSRSFITEGVFPSHILTYQSGPYYRVLSTDANSNFLFYKDARSSSEIGTRLR